MITLSEFLKVYPSLRKETLLYVRNVNERKRFHDGSLLNFKSMTPKELSDKYDFKALEVVRFESIFYGYEDGEWHQCLTLRDIKEAER